MTGARVNSSLQEAVPPDWTVIVLADRCGFKDSKRGGWHWEQTKMRDPARADPASNTPNTRSARSAHP